MLEIKNLSKIYKKNQLKALSDINFKIDRGEFTALLGANGAGKTTLLNIITGVVRADQGDVTLDGESLLRGNRYLKSRLGIVPQELVFDFVFTVQETMELYSGFYGVGKKNDRIEYLLHRLSLWGKRNQKVRALSGGMKRRLLIAKALLHQPDILLLDEPTAGVDINLRQDMYSFLQELHAQGMTIVLTTHYLEEAENLCSRILMLKQGKLVADKSKKDFIEIAGDQITVEIFLANAIDSKSNKPGPLAWKGVESKDSHGYVYSLSLERKKLPDLLESLPELKGNLKDLKITAPKLEDVFIKLSTEEGEL